MAIVSKKIIDVSSLQTMLDSVFNPANQERFYAFSGISGSGERGRSSVGNLYSSATTGTGNASVALTSNVVINVDAGSTTPNAVGYLMYAHYISEIAEYFIYEITLSPAEEFTYAGTITITSATITLNGTMS